MFIYHMDFRDEKKEALINIAMVYSRSFLSFGSAKIIEPHIRATLLRGNIYIRGNHTKGGIILYHGQ